LWGKYEICKLKSYKRHFKKTGIYTQAILHTNDYIKTCKFISTFYKVESSLQKNDKEADCPAP